MNAIYFLRDVTNHFAINSFERCIGKPSERNRKVMQLSWAPTVESPIKDGIFIQSLEKSKHRCWICVPSNWSPRQNPCERTLARRCEANYLPSITLPLSRFRKCTPHLEVNTRARSAKLCGVPKETVSRLVTKWDAGKKNGTVIDGNKDATEPSYSGSNTKPKLKIWSELNIFNQEKTLWNQTEQLELVLPQPNIMVLCRTSS